MLRIHFTFSDLARTRLAGEPSPLATTMFSAFRLAHRTGPSALDLWRRAVRADWRSTAPPLFSELTATGAERPLPGFLRPAEGAGSLDDELERLLSTPRRRFRADLEHVAAQGGLPRWAVDLANGDRTAANGLARSIRDYHRVAVAPYWPGLAPLLAADRTARLRQLQEGGIERVLTSLHRSMRWRPPVLEVEMPGRVDHHLDGRGLVLAPAAFCSYVPCDPGEEQPTLHYEIAQEPEHRALLALLAPSGATPSGATPPGRVPSGRPSPGRPRADLAALLGHSRAAVLEVIAEGVSTGQLARRAGLSPASASEHASVLRRVGLVSTYRSGRTSHHSLTPLGSELLLGATGNAPPAAPALPAASAAPAVPDAPAVPPAAVPAAAPGRPAPDVPPDRTERQGPSGRAARPTD